MSLEYSVGDKVVYSYLSEEEARVPELKSKEATIEKINDDNTVNLILELDSSGNKKRVENVSLNDGSSEGPMPDTFAPFRNPESETPEATAPAEAK